MQELKVLLLCLFFTRCTGISCKDDNGMNADWFVIYKLPEIPDSDNELVKAGVAYYYFDPSVQTGRLSTVGIDSPNQALAKTLDQIYNNHKSENVAYLMYNDAWPNTTTEHWDRGHTKGDVCLDTTGGFWLVQSAPHFPEPSNGSYSWPHNAKMFGQSLMCISAQVEDGSFQKIVTALMYNCPAIFDSNVPPVIKNVVKGLDDVANGNCQDSGEDTHYHTDIKTTDGVALDIFAKSEKFNEDIYSKFLAPYYETDMYAETWQRGEPEDNLKSFCGDYKVENIKSMILSDDVKFPSLDDHSKWAITATDSESRICIGDINRQVGQKERGGGMVCAELPEVRKTYESFISGIEKCEDEHDEL